MEEPPAISKEEYLREGNAICANGNARTAEAARQPVPGDPPDVAETFVRFFVPGIRQQIRDLRSLGYPRGDKETLEAIFTEAEGYLLRVQEDPARIDGHAFDAVNAKPVAYGLHVCGS